MLELTLILFKCTTSIDRLHLLVHIGPKYKLYPPSTKYENQLTIFSNVTLGA